MGRIKESVGRMSQATEIEQGRRGLGHMLRRGLHGAVRWALMDKDGNHHSPMGKLGRATALSAPILLVASAATGGPERGGQSMSVPQSVMWALIITLVGLGCFSAAERKKGRETPWLREGESEPATEPPAPTKVLEGSAMPPEGAVEEGAFQQLPDEFDLEGDGFISPENAQVTEVLSYPDRSDGETNRVNLIKSSETGSSEFQEPLHIPADATPADLPSPAETVAIEPFHPPFRRDPEKEANADEATMVLRVTDTTPSESFPEHPANDETAQVNLPVEAFHTPSDETPATPPMGEGLHKAFHEAPHAPISETEKQQVTGAISGFQEPLQGTLHDDFAPMGPYPVQFDPAGLDRAVPVGTWWLEAPDLPDVVKAESGVALREVPPTEAEISDDQDEVSGPAGSEADETPSGESKNIDAAEESVLTPIEVKQEERVPEVAAPAAQVDPFEVSERSAHQGAEGPREIEQDDLAERLKTLGWKYSAARHDSSYTPEEKRAAREDLAALVRHATISKAFTQKQICDLIRVSEATVSRWAG